MSPVRGRSSWQRLLLSFRRGWFRLQGLSLGGQITLMGIVVIGACLWFPWFTLQVASKSEAMSAWSWFGGGFGYVGLLAAAWVSLLLFSGIQKDAIKSRMSLHVGEHDMIAGLGILTVAHVLTLYGVMVGVQRVFVAQVYIGPGSVLGLIAGLVWIIGGVVLRRELHQDLAHRLYTERVEKKGEDELDTYREMLNLPEEDDRSMKLPF
jgi:hypothetical protein